MPKIKANDITINYDQQGSGEPIILIPFLTADFACYAFQVAEYAKHFTCISVDLRGAGETDKPEGSYTTELLADDVNGLMQVLGIQRAHITGLSLGAAAGMWLAAKYPERVKSLSLHSAWSKTDLFIKTVVESWRMILQTTGSVTELVVSGIFPWCFTPDLYANKPDYIQSLEAFTRSRPPQPAEAFIRQTEAVIGHNAESELSKIKAPTQITFGQFDMITSTRFAPVLQNNIANSELIVFEGASHAPIYEKVEEFNQRTLEFLKRHSD
jgi:pimeloyl-ACP methyl ester carboxylesterase